MADDTYIWDEFYKKIQGRNPRKLLLDVLENFLPGESLQAIDLGSGDGTETVELLSRGWHVLARGSHPCQLQHPVLSPGSFPRLVGADLERPQPRRTFRRSIFWRT